MFSKTDHNLNPNKSTLMTSCNHPSELKKVTVDLSLTAVALNFSNHNLI